MGQMDMSDFPAPADGFVITNFLVVSDQDRSREFYRSVFDAKVVVERDPVILKIAITWLSVLAVSSMNGAPLPPFITRVGAWTRAARSLGIEPSLPMIAVWSYASVGAMASIPAQKGACRMPSI